MPLIQIDGYNIEVGPKTKVKKIDSMLGECILVSCGEGQEEEKGIVDAKEIDYPGGVQGFVDAIIAQWVWTHAGENVNFHG